MKRFKIKNGALFVVGDAMCIGKGVEGCVYNLKNGFVFKHQTLDPKATDPFHFQKLEMLVENGYGQKIKHSCYPTAIVVDEFDNYAGWLSRFVPNSESLHDFYDKGLTEYWTIQQRLTAMRAVSSVVLEPHSNKQFKIFLGDGLKPSNIMFNPRTFACKGIDALSHSICGFRPKGGGLHVNAYCSLTTPGYIAKERLEKPDLNPTASSDIFQLCVILFLLAYDHHPFDPHPIENIDWDRDKAALKGQAFRYVQVPGTRKPDYKTIMPLRIDEMLKRGLLGLPHERPLIEEIVAILDSELEVYSWRNRLKNHLPSKRQVAILAASVALGAVGSSLFRSKTQPLPIAEPKHYAPPPLPLVPPPVVQAPASKPEKEKPKKPTEGKIGPDALNSVR